MSPTETLPTGEAGERETVKITGFWSGRSELLVSAIVLALAGALWYGTATMKIMGDTTPGPEFFPYLVIGLLAVVGVLHAISVVRTRRFPHGGKTQTSEVSSDLLAGLGKADSRSIRGPQGAVPRALGRVRAYSDWKTLGLVLGGLVLFTLTLPVLGWIFSSAILFWIICKAFGSKRPIFDVGVALIFSSLTQLAFNAGLGLNLPSGFLEGLL